MLNLNFSLTDGKFPLHFVDHQPSCKDIHPIPLPIAASVE